MKDLFDLIYTLFEDIIILFTEICIDFCKTSPTRKSVFDANFFDGGSILSKEHHGISADGTRFLNVKTSATHAILFAGSGMGKSSSIFLPTIFNVARGENSLIIHDPSGELMTKSAGFLSSKGYKIVSLNFSSELSNGYNPLTRISTQSDILKCATTIVKNTLGESSGDNIFWNTQTISLLSLLISLLKKQEPRFCNMANLKYLVDNFKSNPDLCDSLVAQSGDEDIIREYKNFISYEPRVLNNIISSCRSSLILFGDPNIQKITSFDSIGDFDNLRREKKAIYIQNKTAEMAYFAPLSSLLLEQAFASIMDRIPSPTEKTIFILIDEASALVTPTLQVGLSNFRKFQCSVVLGYQDYNQVIHSYGRNNAEAIKANCFMRIYFGNQPIETCREIESMLGKFEVEDENGRYKVKNLMEASDIRSIPTNTALVFLGSKSAVFAKLTPFFEQKKLLKYSQMALPERTIQIPSTIEWVKSA